MTDLLKTGDPAFDVFEATYAHLHHKQDTREFTDSIRLQFGSGESMFMANRFAWQRMGMKKNDALLFSLMKDVVRYTMRSAYGEHPKIATLKEATPYLTANFIGRSVECFYMFSLNQRGCLKERILLNEGIADTALFNLRKLLQETSRMHPLGGVIIAHNHPGGTLRPSQEDIDCTLEAMYALSSLNVPLLDHVIVSKHQATSLRYNGFIPEGQWLNQHPKHRILHNWLQGMDEFDL